MGRNPLEKVVKKHRKGLWSPEEDQRLKDYILNRGIGCWSSVPINAGLQRNGKSCRLRWINYLRPGLKRGMFSIQEEESILTLHHTLGNKWSQIAKHLPGRTDNEVKNYWHSYLKKRLPKSEGTATDTESKFATSNTKKVDSSVNSATKVARAELESLERGKELSMANLESRNLPKQGNQSFLPRLVFADWLTMDDPNMQNGPFYQPSSSKDGFGYTTTKQEDLLQVFPYDDGSYINGVFCLDVANDLEKGMLDLPFKFQDQSTLESGFMNLSASGDVICGGFY